METLEQLKEEARQLHESLRINSEKQKRLKNNTLIEKYGFNIGDKVKLIQKGETILGVVSGISRDYWYLVRLFKKDGTLGKREVTVYDAKTMQKTE
jgi:hypothetical protein